MESTTRKSERLTPRYIEGDRVVKHTGDYHIIGTVRTAFYMKSGALRYVVEIDANPEGSFCHIYNEDQLRRV